MSYSEDLDRRIKKIIASMKNTEVKKMFGGMCYLLQGNMLCGIYKDSPILRLGEKGAAEALRSRHTKPFDITGKSMKEWVMAGREGGLRMTRSCESGSTKQRTSSKPFLRSEEYFVHM